MTSAARTDDRYVEGALEALVKKLLYAKSSPDAKKALIEARRLKTIAQKWGAIPPQPDARRELVARMIELAALADGLEVDPDKAGKEMPSSASLDSLAHVSRSGAHAIGVSPSPPPSFEPAPMAVRALIHDEPTAQDGRLVRASRTAIAIQDEPTAPHGKLSKAGLKIGPSLHEEKTAPGHRFAGIHDEKTAPDGADPRHPIEDEPTNPSPSNGEEEEPISSAPSRGSRAKERRAIARGRGAIPLSRSPAAGLSVDSVANGEWTSFADRGSFRILLRDSSARRCAALVKLEPKANFPSSAITDAAALTIITGTAFVSGSELNAGETCAVASGTRRPAIASQEGAVLLFEGSDADECLRAR